MESKKTNEELIEELKDNETLKEILKDSFGGIMYNAKNRNKYDTKKLLETWDLIDEVDKEGIGGIINGAIEFITEED